MIELFMKWIQYTEKGIATFPTYIFDLSFLLDEVSSHYVVDQYMFYVCTLFSQISVIQDVHYEYHG